MKNPSPKIVFISWASVVPRSANIAGALGARNFNIEYFKGTSVFLLPVRYLFQIIKTIHILCTEKPNLIIAMNPPIVLPLIIFLYSRIRKANFVIDSHTGAFTCPWDRFLTLHKFLSRNAETTIVTNEYLERIVRSWGADSNILEDKIPDIKLYQPIKSFDRFSICVINSFLDDEPLEEILAAAKEVSECNFYITGKKVKGNPDIIKSSPENVTFTDFLPDREYIKLINKVDSLMVLTKRDLTMLCGAYEAVAVEKPLITSNWQVLMKYFNKGTIYVDNSPESIKRAVKEVISRKSELDKDIKKLKKSINAKWGKQFKYIVDCIYDNFSI